MSSSANTWGNPENTLGVLNGFFKNTYADKLENLIPDGVKFLNDIKFIAKDKQPGNLYNQPLVLNLEHGITFAGDSEDNFALQASIAGGTQNASVKGYAAVLRSTLGVVALSRSAQAGQKAFEDASKWLVGNMMRSMAKKLEIEVLYGQMGYGLISAVNGAGSVITIKTSEWAPGIWAGSEGMPIEVRSFDGLTSRGTSSVKAVDMDARTVTLEAGILGIVTTSGNEDTVFHKGAYGNEFAGIHKILVNTGSLFGIDAAKYNLFRGNQYSASSAALSFAKLNQAIARSVEKGLEGTVTCYVNPRTWGNLLSDQAALRRYDDSYSVEKSETGSRSLMFYSQNGDIRIVSSIFVKEGYSYLLSMQDWVRVGSTDMTFKIPGMGEQFFRQLENNMGVELRLYTDQALFCFAPGRSTLIKDIVNTV